jgi:hypothetical protein
VRYSDDGGELIRRSRPTPAVLDRGDHDQKSVGVLGLVRVSRVIDGDPELMSKQGNDIDADRLLFGAVLTFRRYGGVAPHAAGRRDSDTTRGTWSLTSPIATGKEKDRWA